MGHGVIVVSVVVICDYFVSFPEEFFANTFLSQVLDFGMIKLGINNVN